MQPDRPGKLRGDAGGKDAVSFQRKRGLKIRKRIFNPRFHIDATESAVRYTLYTVSVSFGNFFSSFGTSHMARHAQQMPITAPPSTSVG